MSPYRAYLIGEDGRIAKAIELRCEDDNAAIEAAELILDSRDVELWDGSRKMACFNKTPERSLNTATRQEVAGARNQPSS